MKHRTHATIYTNNEYISISRYTVKEACLQLLKHLYKTHDIVIHNIVRHEHTPINTHYRAFMVIVDCIVDSISKQELIHIYEYNGTDIDQEYIQLTEYRN